MRATEKLIRDFFSLERQAAVSRKDNLLIIHQLLIVTSSICCLSAVSRQYEVGQTYVYLLKSDVFLNDGSDHVNQKTGRQVGYGLEGKVKLTPLWRDPQTISNRIVEIDLDDAHLVVTPAEKK